MDGPSGHLFGDGFAMWLAKKRMSTGPVFGSVNNFEGLGIFFDTYDNERSHVREEVKMCWDQKIGVLTVPRFRNTPSHMSKLWWVTVISTMIMTRTDQQPNWLAVRYDTN